MRKCEKLWECIVYGRRSRDTALASVRIGRPAFVLLLPFNFASRTCVTLFIAPDGFLANFVSNMGKCMSFLPQYNIATEWTRHKALTCFTLYIFYIIRVCTRRPFVLQQRSHVRFYCKTTVMLLQLRTNITTWSSPTSLLSRAYLSITATLWIQTATKSTWRSVPTCLVSSFFFCFIFFFCIQICVASYGRAAGVHIFEQLTQYVTFSYISGDNYLRKIYYKMLRIFLHKDCGCFHPTLMRTKYSTLTIPRHPDESVEPDCPGVDNALLLARRKLEKDPALGKPFATGVAVGGTVSH